MRKLNISLAIIWLILTSLACKQPSKSGELPKQEDPVQDTSSMKYRAFHGASMQIDPTFPYYKDRSIESIVEEISLAGYRSVHYFVVNENEVNGTLIKAFRAKGIPVWLMVVGNGTYSTKGLPQGWESWKMEMTREVNGGGFTFFSLFNKDFTNWKKKSLVKLISDYPFDGVEMAETYFPEWDAIRTGRYGDVGPVAKKAFKEKYNLEMPDFKNPSADNYYTKNKELYDKWMQFRVEGVNDFQNEIYNGGGGVRKTRPDILVATWSLGVGSGTSAVAKLREDHGLDAASLVAKVMPDLHFIQTHWPDWVKPEAQLPASYMKNYKAFVDPIKNRFPNMPVGLQADQGSVKDMIKSAAWVNKFNEEAAKNGYITWTSYEYHLGGYIYEGAPKPVKIVRAGADSIILSFNKRIDEASGTNLANYKLLKDGVAQPAAIKMAKVDGNRAILTLNSSNSGNISIAVNHISDTPSLRLYKDTPMNTMKEEVIVLLK